MVDERSVLGQLILAVIVAIAVIWVFFGDTIANWWNTWGLIIIIGIIIIVLVIIFLFRARLSYGGLSLGSYSYSEYKDINHSSSNEKPVRNYQETTYQTKPSLNVFESVLLLIDEEFKPELVRDETDLENQLVIWLKAKIPNRINRQFNTDKGKIDIVIDEKYAIELKIADNKGKLRDLAGQILFYKKAFDNVAVFLLDVGCISKDEIEEFIGMYRDLGVLTLVKKGVLKRRKGGGKEVNIKWK